VIKITLRKDFDEVMAAGIASKTAHFALHLKANVNLNRIGAVVPKRWAKKAVTRNAIRRQIYAQAQTWSLVHKTHDSVVRLRRPFDQAIFLSATSTALKKAVRDELHQLFDKVTHHD
jgi:ribonuclease P protein component